ncbi:hypothetical protein Q3G72_004104 [Acer saccharum]|nr:hypothetical protein Q3G72_004104 [Acer saccharum]
MIHFSDEFYLRAFGYTEALGHDGSDSSHSGLTLHLMLAIPLNKKLYTFSYVCLTSGAALVFSAIYALYFRDAANVAAAINGCKFPRSDAGFVLEDLKALSTEVDIWDLKYLKASTDWHEYYACLLNGS